MAGMQPRAIQAAGEIADGLIGVLYTPRFITEVALPNLQAGARRAGRDPSDVDLVGYTICSCSDDRAEALRRARRAPAAMAIPLFRDAVDERPLGLRL